MSDQSTLHRPSDVDAVTISSLLAEYRDGRDPLVTYATAAVCLVALGRPLSESAVRDLLIDARTLGGRSVARLGDFVKSADAMITRRTARPNLKAQAAAKARAARGRGKA